MVTGKCDVDPVFAVLHARVMALRRAWCKHPAMRAELQAVLDRYIAEGKCGTRPPVEEDADPGWTCCSQDRECSGPVALLLVSLRGLGAWVDGGWRLHDARACVHGLLSMPVQQIKPMLRSLADNRRVNAFLRNRSVDPVEVDLPTWRR
eukprot:14181595-Alexandrium_andersonii.AAC.1